MYKIEKFLIDNGMKLKRSYPVGTLIYQDYCSDSEDEGFYGVDEVILFPTHKTNGEPTPTWEISTSYPYLLIIPGYREVESDFIENAKENLEEHLKRQIEFNKKMLEVENPWEIINE